MSTESSSEASNEISELDITNLDYTRKSQIEKAVDHVFGNVTKASAAKQVVVGGGAGWLAGFLAVKIGKSVALTVGATIFALQVAQHKGIIQVNWTKVHHAINGVHDSALSLIDSSKEDVTATVKRFYNDNFFLASGFAGGFAAGVLF